MLLAGGRVVDPFQNSFGAGSGTTLPVRRGGMDAHQLGYWLFCVSLMLAPLLMRAPGVREKVEVVLGRLSTAEAETLDHDDELGQFPETWYAVTRRERLLADVERLRRLVATDMGKSAVRQLGNRLAYNQLLKELAETPEPPWSVAALPGLDGGSTIVAASSTRDGAGERGWRPLQQVETLEIGGRR